MRLILAVSLFLSLSSCPDSCDHDYSDHCSVTAGVRTYGVHMNIEVQPGAKTTTADVEVVITRPHYGLSDDAVAQSSGHGHGALPPADDSPRSPDHKQEHPVREWEDPYEEEVKFKLHWSCPTLEKSGEVEVTVAAESATGKVEISDLPPQPQLTVYPWEFKRGLECILITEDEKTAQEREEQAKQGAPSSDDSDEDEEISDEEMRTEYRGERAFFIKKPAPEVKLSQIAVVAGNPDSYADVKVELLRNEAAVVAGDRSFDLDVEVKLPWLCEGVTPPLKSGDTHIVIPAGAGSGEARLIMPAQQAVKLTCAVDANAYIDSFIIGRNAKTLEFDIPKL